jgi:hypothetical protein
MSSKVVSEAVVVGTTAAALKSTTKVVLSCLIQALSTNTQIVYLGGSDVSSANGLALPAGGAVSLAALVAGEQTEDWDLSKIFAVSPLGTQAIRILYQQGI